MEKYIIGGFVNSVKFLGNSANHWFLSRRLKLTSQTTKQIVVKGLYKATGCVFSSPGKVSV